MDSIITINSSLNASNKKFAIVASKFNSFFVQHLVSGATEALRQNGAILAQQKIFWVPGALEIPLMCKHITANASDIDAIICLGVIIKGETRHFDIVAKESASGITQISLDSGIPITNGILAVKDLNQATQRCGGKSGNKGHEAAIAAIEMSNLIQVSK